MVYNYNVFYTNIVMLCAILHSIFPLGNAYSKNVLVHVILLLDHVNLIHDVCLHY